MPGTTRTNHQGSGSSGGNSVTLSRLEELCDDPARDLPGGTNVRALLSYFPEQGFYLSAQDGEMVYRVTDDAGKQIRFRTIEAAIAMLQNVAGLSSDVGLFQAAQRACQH